MATEKKCYTDYGTYNMKRNTVDDILEGINWDEFYDGLFEKIKDIDCGIYHDRRRKIFYRSLNNKIINIFCEMVIKDMIFDNITYQFPYNKMKMQVANDKFHQQKYYNVKTGGKIFRPLVKASRKLYKSLEYGRVWMMFTRRWRLVLLKEINKGHEYSEYGVN